MDATKLGLKVEKVNGKHPETDEYRGSALFESTGVDLANAPLVPCNRVGDGCMTPIDSLELHNQHKPWFTSEESRDAWVKRIQDATEKAAAEYGGEEAGE